MIPQHAAFVQSVKELPGGITEAFTLLELIREYDRRQAQTTQGKKTRRIAKEDDRYAKIGAAILDKVPMGVRGRRKGQIDHGSNRQRVWVAVANLLKKHKKIHCTQVMEHVQQVTGLTFWQTRLAAYTCPHKQLVGGGYWSLLKEKV